MKKPTNEVAASLIIYRVPRLSDEQRKMLGKWLRKMARDVLEVCPERSSLCQETFCEQYSYPPFSISEIKKIDLTLRGVSPLVIHSARTRDCT